MHNFLEALISLHW